jgi:hypothetical protein
MEVNRTDLRGEYFQPGEAVLLSTTLRLSPKQDGLGEEEAQTL